MALSEQKPERTVRNCPLIYFWQREWYDGKKRDKQAREKNFFHIYSLVAIMNGVSSE